MGDTLSTCHLIDQSQDVFFVVVFFNPRSELDAIRPTHVINSAGVTGRPNVDWCESNKEATIRSNVIGVFSVFLLLYVLIHAFLFDAPFAPTPVFLFSFWYL